MGLLSGDLVGLIAVFFNDDAVFNVLSCVGAQLVGSISLRAVSDMSIIVV